MIAHKTVSHATAQCSAPTVHCTYGAPPTHNPLSRLHAWHPHSLQLLSARMAACVLVFFVAGTVLCLLLSWRRPGVCGGSGWRAPRPLLVHTYHAWMELLHAPWAPCVHSPARVVVVVHAAVLGLRPLLSHCVSAPNFRLIQWRRTSVCMSAASHSCCSCRCEPPVIYQPALKHLGTNEPHASAT